VVEWEAMRNTDPEPEHEHEIVEATVSAVILGTFQDLLCWHFLNEALQDLVIVMKHHKNDLGCGHPSPVEYQKAFAKLSSFARYMLSMALDDLCNFYTGSTAFAKYVKYVKPLPQSKLTNSDTPRRVLDHRNAEKLYGIDRLLPLLTQLCHDTRNIPLVLPELNNLLLRHDEANRLNFQMMHTVSEIVDLWRLVEFCRHQRPLLPEMKQDSFKKDACLAARCSMALTKAVMPEEFH
jgi:hypothetical protein